MEEVFQRLRLDQIAVCLQCVSVFNILKVARAGQYGDRDVAQTDVALDFAKHLARVSLRQVEIQEDEMRLRNVGKGLLAV